MAVAVRFVTLPSAEDHVWREEELATLDRAFLRPASPQPLEIF